MPKIEKLNIIDVESTCDTKPIKNEIIEIGIVQINYLTLDILQAQSYIIKPEHSIITPFCTELTGITQEDVDLGISFNEAIGILIKKFGIIKFQWASWGDYDRIQFQRNFMYHDMKYMFGRTHINLKHLFAVMYGLDREVGMDVALKMLNMSLDGDHHRGLDDALNIMKIYKHVIQTYRKNKNCLMI